MTRPQSGFNPDAPLHGEMFEEWDWSQLAEFKIALVEPSKVNAQLLANEIRRQPAIAKASWDRTLLHLVAGEGYLDLVMLLLDLGADVNAYCPEGIPLHYAVHSGSLDVVKTLVAAGSELNRQDCRRSTPLDLAYNPAHDYVIVKYLVTIGAIPNKEVTVDGIRNMKQMGLWDQV
ncbi:ankyrin repeat domain-containing protein [Gemmata sp. G18]|uniref:Ankyrin repeat domain-containing protein n=1 Tax=Gemmata palustris TaxID=2822762 RepID=A0ABS5BTN9_9BACT|nr:ankyrin repeat domain-containing protein [Gemmata palustris]MBP3957093.1 ankyrin repeat domain-containing protein [Gemmata palustris]